MTAPSSTPTVASSESGSVGLFDQSPVTDTGLILTTSGTTTASGVSARPSAGRELSTTHGTTTIADAVVATVADRAAREISGVADLGSGTDRVVGAVSERIPGSRSFSAPGVSVEVGDRQAAVDLTVITECGMPIVPIGHAIRRNVIATIEQMTGLEVVEVNVVVADLRRSDAGAHRQSDERRAARQTAGS